MLVIIVLCLWVGDWYPFSRFPMYAKLAPTTQCLYIARADGTPVLIGSELSLQPFVLRKIYNTKIDELKRAVPGGKRSRVPPEKMQAAAAEVLEWFRGKYAAEGQSLHAVPLKLMAENYAVKNGRVRKTTEILAGP